MELSSSRRGVKGKVVTSYTGASVSCEVTRGSQSLLATSQKLPETGRNAPDQSGRSDWAEKRGVIKPNHSQPKLNQCIEGSMNRELFGVFTNPSSLKVSLWLPIFRVHKGGDLFLRVPGQHRHTCRTKNIIHAYCPYLHVPSLSLQLEHQDDADMSSLFHHLPSIHQGRYHGLATA